MPANQKCTQLWLLTKYKKTHIAANIILKEGYIMGCNLLNRTNMVLCVKDLRYSAFCLSCITAQIWLDMMLYHNIYKLIDNMSLFLWIITPWSWVHHWLSHITSMYCLCLQLWFKHTRMSYKRYIAQHYSAILTFRCL